VLPQANGREFLKNHMNTSIGGLFIAVDMMELALEKFKATAAALAVLAERAIYESGAWPQGVEYPPGRPT
jgi:hypothetical protein